MKIVLVIAGCFLLVGCNSKKNNSQQLIRVDDKWLDSVRRSGDTAYVKKYGTSRFAKAEYYLNKKNAVICQVMKDSTDSIRQIIITKNNRRSFFEEYYPNGQLIARLPLDSFGQYHGPSKYYYLNGLVESAGDYKNGLKTGIWKNNNGSGKLISTSEYDTNGQVSKTTYQK